MTRHRLRPNRRQFLQSLGLGALAGLGLRGRAALADPATPPTRIVFFVQPHGHVPGAWKLPIPNSAPGSFAERALAPLAPADFGPVLRPLHAFRDRLLAIEGLAHTSVLADIAEVKRSGGDLNNHSISVAGLLSGARAMQQGGLPCTGGARSLDQEIAVRTAAPGRFASRVYGFDYVPNVTVAPFSFLGPGQASPMVSDPAVAFADLLSYYQPPMGGAQSRADKLRALRPSVLDAAAREYDLLAPHLGRDARARLEAHRDLVRQLELALAANVAPQCEPSFSAAGHSVTQFMRLIRLAFACDLTRVVTFVAPVPPCAELGYAADATFHQYAHQSIQGNTSCGQQYNPVAEHALTDLGAWYAGHLATLLGELDSVVEGSGTLLDHTVVVWLTELATPTHQHHDVCTLLAGGASGYFKTGRYLRYPASLPSPLANFPVTGPALNHLFVNLLEAMGQRDGWFGMKETVAADGTLLSLSGALPELRA